MSKSAVTVKKLEASLVVIPIDEGFPIGVPEVGTVFAIGVPEVGTVFAPAPP